MSHSEVISCCMFYSNVLSEEEEGYKKLLYFNIANNFLIVTSSIILLIDILMETFTIYNCCIGLFIIKVCIQAIVLPQTIIHPYSLNLISLKMATESHISPSSQMTEIPQLKDRGSNSNQSKSIHKH